MRLIKRLRAVCVGTCPRYIVPCIRPWIQDLAFHISTSNFVLFISLVFSFQGGLMNKHLFGWISANGVFIHILFGFNKCEDEL